MNLLILMGKFTGGGSQRVAAHLSKALPDSVHSTFLLTSPDTQYSYRGEVRYVSLVPFTRRGQYLRHARRFFQKVQAIRACIKAGEADVILSFDPEWALVGSFVSKNLIFSVRNTLSLSYGTGWRQRLTLWLIAFRARGIIPVSEGVSRDLKKTYDIESGPVVVNGIASEAINTEAAFVPTSPVFSRWISEDIPLIITVGRRAHQKGQTHLVRAFSRVRSQFPCRLIFIGNGVSKDPELQRLIKKTGSKDDILLMEAVANPFAYLARANIFVLSSLYEGFPNVLLEAMACGLPVISTDCPSGPREILAPATSVTKVARSVEHTPYGILTPPLSGEKLADEPLTFSEVCLADALQELVAHSEYRKQLSHAARNRARDFTLKRFATEWRKVLLS